MEVKQLFDILRKEAECSFCIHPFNKPKTLPCLHSFCLDCLNKYAATRRQQGHTTFDCPVCLATFQLPDNDKFDAFQTAFHQNRLLDILALEQSDTDQQKSCANCDENAAASSYCFECQTFICSVRAHRTVGVNGQLLTGSPWNVHVTPHQYQAISSFGSSGTAEGQFNGPCGLSVSSTGNVAVADFSGQKVQVFTSDGKHMKEFGQRRMKGPEYVAYTNSDHIIVVGEMDDGGNNDNDANDGDGDNDDRNDDDGDYEHDGVDDYVEDDYYDDRGADYDYDRNDDDGDYDGADDYVDDYYDDGADDDDDGEDDYYDDGGDDDDGEDDYYDGGDDDDDGEDDYYDDGGDDDDDGEDDYYDDGADDDDDGEYDYYDDGGDDDDDGEYDYYDDGGDDDDDDGEDDYYDGGDDDDDGEDDYYDDGGDYGEDDYYDDRGDDDDDGEDDYYDDHGDDYVEDDYYDGGGDDYDIGDYDHGGDYIESDGGGGDDDVISYSQALMFTRGGTFLGEFSPAHLKRPFGISVTNKGYVIVCDREDKLVKVLSPDGKKFLHSFSAPDCNEPPANAVYYKKKFFVSYTAEDCIKVFDVTGKYIHDICGDHTGNNPLCRPRGVAIDKFGHLLVVDQGNHRLQVFTTEGEFVSKTGGQGTELGQFNNPTDVAVSKDGHVYVTDTLNNRVQVLI